MLYDIRHPDFTAVIRDGAELTCLATGYAFTEGPAWHPVQQHLTFSDIAANTMYRWDWDAGPPRVYRQPSHKANGNTYDREGRLLSCEHATSRVVREAPDGTLSVLASHHGDKELNSPNDIIVARDGAIWFTDPMAGRRPFFGIPRPQELDFQGLWRLAPDGSACTPVITDFDLPNGLCFSPDETVLYVNDTTRAHIRRFDHAPDGTLSGGSVFADLTGEGEGVADGMKTDTQGRLWCTGPGGVHVFAADGTSLGVIRIPEKTANFTWAGPDRSTLITTSSTSLYRLQVAATGPALFAAPPREGP